VNGWSVAFVGGVVGYGIAHYLPLDGTVFKDSRSVDSKLCVGMGSLGMKRVPRRFGLEPRGNVLH
jgi:hypothetical protein